MKQAVFILLIAAAGFVACATVSLVGEQPQQLCDDPLPIVSQPDIREHSARRNYVMLSLDYGEIICNTAEGSPYYCLFNRKSRRIVKTQDIRVFLKEIEEIPDRSRIDMIDKCTVPFYVDAEFETNITAEYSQAMQAFLRKQVSFNDGHADFCYCEDGFTVADHTLFPAAPATGKFTGSCYTQRFYRIETTTGTCIFDLGQIINKGVSNWYMTAVTSLFQVVTVPEGGCARLDGVPFNAASSFDITYRGTEPAFLCLPTDKGWQRSEPVVTDWRLFRYLSPKGTTTWIVFKP